MLTLCTWANLAFSQTTQPRDSISRAERHRTFPQHHGKQRTDPLHPIIDIDEQRAERHDSLLIPVDCPDTTQADTLKGRPVRPLRRDSIAAQGSFQQATQGTHTTSQQGTMQQGTTQQATPSDTTTAPRDTLAATPLPEVSLPMTPDQIAAWTDSIERAHREQFDQRPLDGTQASQRTDSMLISQGILAIAKEVKQFTPDPQRALWLSLVFPGAGQAYNHKYWKIPIFYGGFLGCTYALTWNNQMLRDYSQAYLDIMDDDPNTKSYMDMLPMGYDITGREEKFKEIFKHKKNYYRKYRDMSIFAFAGVYMLSVIDAFVDAELSTFDISRDLSLRLEPTSMRDSGKMTQCFAPQGVGLACKMNF